MTGRPTAPEVALRIADRINPLTNSPSAPLKTRALFSSFAPSLMPRASLHQGVAIGFSILAADLVMSAVDAGVRRLIPNSAPFALRVGARVALSVAGLAVSKIPETDDESTTKASIRTLGRLALAGGIGGIVPQVVGRGISDGSPWGGQQNRAWCWWTNREAHFVAPRSIAGRVIGLDPPGSTSVS